MGALIFAGAYGGKYLDQFWNLQKPWMTMLGTLSGMAIGLYLLLKGLNSDKDV